MAHFDYEQYDVSLHNVSCYLECIFWQCWKKGMSF